MLLQLLNLVILRDHYQCLQLTVRVCPRLQVPSDLDVLVQDPVLLVLHTADEFVQQLLLSQLLIQRHRLHLLLNVLQPLFRLHLRLRQLLLQLLEQVCFLYLLHLRRVLPRLDHAELLQLFLLSQALKVRQHVLLVPLQVLRTLLGQIPDLLDRLALILPLNLVRLLQLVLAAEAEVSAKAATLRVLQRFLQLLALPLLALEDLLELPLVIRQGRLRLVVLLLHDLQLRAAKLLVDGHEARAEVEALGESIVEVILLPISH